MRLASDHTIHGKTYSRVRSVCGWRVIIPYMISVRLASVHTIHGKIYSRVRSVCGWRVIIPYMGKYIRELDQCAVGE